ncbi:MAG: hypothetical protein N2A40_06610 [Desulfobulbaceae bacterium]
MAMTLVELKQHKTNIELDLEKIERKYNRANTNHILHLILSLITMGFWIIAWLLIAYSNSAQRARLETLMDESRKTIIEIDSKLIPEAKERESPLNGKSSIECPWCAEIILAKAKICKHCGKEVQSS